MVSREVWIGEFSDTKTIEEFVRRRDAEGYDGLTIGDSQNRYEDPFVTLTLAARSSERIGLGTGVTNPVTRHPAVTACVIASIQEISNGRAVLGIGRGDSALASLGLAPAPFGTLDRFVTHVQSYLSGAEAPVGLPEGGRAFDGSALPGVATLAHGEAPSNRIEWLPSHLPKVPVDVYVTGPRAIGLAARIGDRVTFAVGAETERIRQAIKTARDAREAAGLDPDGLSCGATMAIGIDEDLRAGRRRIAGIVASFARFAAMHAAPNGASSDQHAGVFEQLLGSYNMTNQAVVSSSQTEVLPDEFIDRYAVTGSPSTCRDRLLEMYELGLDRVKLIFHARGVDRGEIERSYQLFASDVLPAIHQSGQSTGS
jgi:5,10-methylenetetrahydromethanopterin reductase